MFRVCFLPIYSLLLFWPFRRPRARYARKKSPPVKRHIGVEVTCNEKKLKSATFMSKHHGVDCSNTPRLPSSDLLFWALQLLCRDQYV